MLQRCQSVECKLGLLKLYSSSPVRVQVGPPQILLQLPRQSVERKFEVGHPQTLLQLLRQSVKRKLGLFKLYSSSPVRVQVGPPQILLQLPRQSVERKFEVGHPQTLLQLLRQSVKRKLGLFKLYSSSPVRV